MNYQKHYDQLIKSRKLLNRKKKQGIYYENHHIIPVWLNGSNDKNNLVLLTGREHFIAHRLLAKIYKDPSSLYALANMGWDNKNGRKLTSKQFEITRIAFAQANSLAKSGIILTEEHKRKIGEAGMGSVFSEESRLKKSKSLKGKIFTEEHKQNLRKPKSEEHKRKLSEAAKLRDPATRKHSEETKKKIRESNKNNFTQERRDAISERNKNRIVSEETRQKIGDSKRGIPLTEEHKEKLRNFKHSEESKAKMRESSKNRPPMTEETKQKISIGNKGKTMSEEAKQKISIANTGTIPSEETRQKMSNSHKGKPIHTEESKEKIRESNRRRGKNYIKDINNGI